MSRVLLQDFVPYDTSAKWDIHHRYFQQRGGVAWLHGEIPYYVTSNTAAALQNVKLVAAAVEEMEKEGSLTSEEPITVLEMASGLGLFAWNFVQMLQKLDAENGTSHAKRLRYLFTDFSRQTVEDGRKVAALKELENEGVLIFGVLDALDPASAKTLNGESLQLDGCVAVITNYLQCCLPLTILRKTGDVWREKNVRLWIDVPEGEEAKSFCQRALKEPVGFDVLGRLSEDEEYTDLHEGVIRDPKHLKVIEALYAQMPVATVIYPYGSIQSFERTLPILRNGGIILHTDKGYPNISWSEGECKCEPSLHGNCFAHSFHFPLAEAYALATELCATRTDDEDLSIHTLFIEKRKEPRLDSLFHTLFRDQNCNTDRSDFYDAGRKNEGEGNFAEAARFYQRALAAAPSDSSILFHLGICIYELRQYGKSIEAFAACKDSDIFREFDSEFRQGLALHALGRYPDALSAYETSLLREEHEVTRYNIGLCLEEMRRFQEAKEQYEHALMRNPGYEKAQIRLGEILRMLTGQSLSMN